MAVVTDQLIVFWVGFCFFFFNGKCSLLVVYPGDSYSDGLFLLKRSMPWALMKKSLQKNILLAHPLRFWW